MTALVSSIAGLAIAIIETEPAGLVIEIEGRVATPGWRRFALAHEIYIAPPADGIYEADMVGLPPAGDLVQLAMPFRHEEIWAPFPADLRGLKVRSATNVMVAMLG